MKIGAGGRARPVSSACVRAPPLEPLQSNRWETRPPSAHARCSTATWRPPTGELQLRLQRRINEAVALSLDSDQETR